MTIDRFVGQHRFLSNFAPSPMRINVQGESDLGRAIRRAAGTRLYGLTVEYDHATDSFHVVVSSVEHGFQSDKAASAVEQLEDIAVDDDGSGCESECPNVWLREQHQPWRPWCTCKEAKPDASDPERCDDCGDRLWPMAVSSPP